MVRKRKSKSFPTTDTFGHCDAEKCKTLYPIRQHQNLRICILRTTHWICVSNVNADLKLCLRVRLRIQLQNGIKTWRPTPNSLVFKFWTRTQTQRKQTTQWQVKEGMFRIFPGSNQCGMWHHQASLVWPHWAKNIHWRYGDKFIEQRTKSTKRNVVCYAKADIRYCVAIILMSEKKRLTRGNWNVLITLDQKSWAPFGNTDINYQWKIKRHCHQCGKAWKAKTVSSTPDEIL